MKRLSVVMGVLVVLVGATVQAQEIGTEITPVTPDNRPPPNNSQPNDNPYATQPKETDNAKPAEKAKAAAPMAEGGSADKGAFGIRATFGGQGVPTGGGTGNVALPTGTVGLSYWATEQFTLLFDLGFGMSVRGAFGLGFGVTVGMDYHFRTAADSLRPLINLQVGLGAPITSNIGAGMGLFGQFGGGAEYFFSPSFSLSGRLGLGFALSFDGGAFTLTTFTPAVGAAWYF